VKDRPSNVNQPVRVAASPSAVGFMPPKSKLGFAAGSGAEHPAASITQQASNPRIFRSTRLTRGSASAVAIARGGRTPDC